MNQQNHRLSQKGSAEMKVFVSSNNREMSEYRKVARDVLVARNHQVIMMDYFPASGVRPKQYCQARVRECDLFVGILGACYGSSPPGDDMSYSEIEYREALSLGKQCLMFLNSDDYAVKQSALKGETRLQAQEGFRAEVTTNTTCRFFATPEEFKFELADSMERAADAVPAWQASPVDCVILVGGKASRLWPLTLDLCKELLPVAGKPVLGYTIDALRRCSLVSSITVLTGRQFSNQIEAFLKDASLPDVRVRNEPVARDGKRQGPLGALSSVLPDFSHDLFLIGGDNLFSFDFDGFLSFARGRGHSANAFYSFETGYDQCEYGVGDLASDDRIVTFSEKERIPACINVSTACYLFRREELSLLDEYMRTGGDRCSLGSFVGWLVRRGIPLDGFRTSTPWFDVGTRHKYLDANRKYMIDRVDGEVDQGSRQNIKGPVQIEHGSSIRDCPRIGPNVYIGPGVHVSESALEDCVVMENAIINRSNIKRAIVGPDSHVEGAMYDCVIGKGSHLLAEPTAIMTSALT